MSTTGSRTTRWTAAISRHRGRAAAGGLALVVGIMAVVAVSGGTTTASAASGPTATAAARDLVTTLETTGVLERTEQQTISYAGTVAPAGAVAPATTTSPSGDMITAPPTVAQPTVAAEELPVAAPELPVAAPETTEQTAVSAQADPMACSAPGTEALTTITTPCRPDDTATTPPTTVAPAVTTTTAPPVAAPTTTTSRPTTSIATSGRPATPEATTAAGARPGAAAPGAPTAVAEAEPVVLTAIPEIASGVERGTVLYAVDDEPVVALVGPIPAWRTLEVGVDAGTDVRQLEENLAALGYAGVSVDDEFTLGTAAAVKRWEAALGRADPDGVVDRGDVAFLALPGKVLAHEAGVGDPLDVGTPILVLGSRQQLVRATVAAAEAAAWAAGTEISLTWSDGASSTGTVSGTGHDVTDGMVELVVALGEADYTRPSGAQVMVTSVDARRDGVVAVPVAAVVEGLDGEPAVERTMVAGSADRLVTVTMGIVAGGWVEIRSGIALGDAVRLPG